LSNSVVFNLAVSAPARQPLTSLKDNLYGEVSRPRQTTRASEPNWHADDCA
jgi:hypothetical protein